MNWMSLLGCKSKDWRSCCKTWPKWWGLSWNPWGRTVNVSCWERRESGSVQVKVNKGWDVGCKRIVKKASLRSNTVKNWVVAGIVERRV
jgi:hypothetical protein